MMDRRELIAKLWRRLHAGPPGPFYRDPAERLAEVEWIFDSIRDQVVDEVRAGRPLSMIALVALSGAIS